ncbi:MAG: hypothetical protein IJR45_04655, partial [Firmicutes bacterium]|nr:hypothetical protein [Bacillota bacterium]
MKKEFNFSTSFIFAYLRGKAEVTERDIKLDMPNTIAHIIPMGVQNQVIPLRNISSASAGLSIRGIFILIGIAFLMLTKFSFSLINSPSDFFQWLLFPFLSILSFMHAFVYILTIQRSGNNFFIQVPFYETKKIRDFSSAITEALNYEADKTDIIKNVNPRLDEQTAIASEQLELVKAQMAKQEEQTAL